MAKKEIKKDPIAETPLEKPVKGKNPLMIMYIKNTTKELFEVNDNNPESRVGAIPVAPSNYKAGATNYKITTEDIAKYPILSKLALPNDIVDLTEFNAFVGKE